jgi:hypothetical protein
VIHASRRAALRGLLRTADVEALLVTDLVNVRYLSGFTGSNASLLVHVDGDAASRFLTDGRYAAQSASEVPDLERVIDRAGPVVLAAAATAAAGPVGFVALAAPQLARRLARLPNPGLVTSGLMGAGLLLASDIAGQRLLGDTQLPVGIMTGLTGGAYLAWLLATERTRGRN